MLLLGFVPDFQRFVDKISSGQGGDVQRKVTGIEERCGRAYFLESPPAVILVVFKFKGLTTCCMNRWSAVFDLGGEDGFVL